MNELTLAELNDMIYVLGIHIRTNKSSFRKVEMQHLLEKLYGELERREVEFQADLVTIVRAPEPEAAFV